MCRNTEGSYSCSCLSDYRADPHNRDSCRVARGKVGILYAGQTEIRLLDLQTETSSVLVSQVSADRLHFHWSEARVFWLERQAGSLFSASLHSPASQQPRLVLAGLAGAEDLAVDWLHRLLIWPDSGLQTISLASLGTAVSVCRPQ